MYNPRNTVFPKRQVKLHSRPLSGLKLLCSCAVCTWFSLVLKCNLKQRCWRRYFVSYSSQSPWLIHETDLLCHRNSLHKVSGKIVSTKNSKSKSTPSLQFVSSSDSFCWKAEILICVCRRLSLYFKLVLNMCPFFLEWTLITFVLPTRGLWTILWIIAA